MYYESSGDRGAEPDVKEVRELVGLLGEWRDTQDFKTREAIWHRMLAIYSDQVFSIGLVNATWQPVVVSRSLRNVPDQGLFGFDPLAFLGAYLPDTFWFDGAGK
jgi:peptide/nickel transport system substrate-binding protein